MPEKLPIFRSFFKHRILAHLLFWFGILIVTAYHGSLFGGTFLHNLLNMMALLPVQIAAAYLLVYYQIPRWLFKSKWLPFLISFVVIAFLASVVARISVIYIAETLIRKDLVRETLWQIVSDPLYLVKVYSTSVYLPAFILFLIKMAKERFTQQNRLDLLEKEKRTAELNFLKAQMNPHFLFNTLNNLYGLAKSGSDQTGDMILKLSEILDYTLYECNEPTVLVTREWQLIENHSDLESLRITGKLDLALRRQIDDDNARIAPLILIALVENAFKHGLGANRKSAKIKISLEVKKGILSFEVMNAKTDALKTKKMVNNRGIGISNVKRQLALQYPGRHQFDVQDETEFHQVNLTIQL